MNRPNILFLLTDQHRAISTGCYGPTDARTPVIDELSKSSILFERAYCQYPICTASRQSLLTGRYPGANGTYQNNLASIDPLQWTFPRALALAGYDTALVGKSHCNTAGFLTVMDSEECARRYWPKDRWSSIQPPLFGFDYRCNAATAAPWPHDEKYLQNEFVLRHSLRFAAQRRSAPFFLFASFDFPHPPFLPPRRWWEAFDPDGLSLPPGFPCPPNPFWGEELLAEPLVRNYLRGYYACLAAVDESIGNLLDGLRGQGLLDNTIVIYTSDHGEAGGMHGKYEKHSFFDSEVRVPLLISVPGLPARRVSHIVELLDLAPTLLELVGAPLSSAELDGRSLCGLLSGQLDGWKNRAFAENYWPARVERDGSPKPEDHGRMLVRDRWKICLGGNMPAPFSLFDLERDPDELRNLWDVPELAPVRDRLREECETGWVRAIPPLGIHPDFA